MASKPFLIVFDCDGTLADSQNIIAEAMRFAFRSIGFAVPDHAAVMRIVGLSLDEAVFALAPQADEALRAEAVRAYRERYLALRLRGNVEPLFPGAASLLRKLAEREDTVLGIATGKSKRGLIAMLEQNGINGLFSTMQTADDAPSKPHPAMLMQAMNETGAAAHSTVMIGDTSHDTIMATAANVASIGVTWGYHSAAELRRAGATRIANSFAELERLLDARPICAPLCEVVA